jgi:hypothetical protein
MVGHLTFPHGLSTRAECATGDFPGFVRDVKFCKFHAAPGRQPSGETTVFEATIFLLKARSIARGGG